MRCPDEVSVTGYNALSFVSRLTPPLTTVGVPLDQMGELAAEALLAWMVGSDHHVDGHQTLLPVEFVERATTAAAARTARRRLIRAPSLQSSRAGAREIVPPHRRAHLSASARRVFGEVAPTATAKCSSPGGGRHVLGPN